MSRIVALADIGVLVLIVVAAIMCVTYWGWVVVDIVIAIVRALQHSC